MDEIQVLREEIAKLRERVAVLEAGQQPAAPAPLFDWKQPLHVGSPRFVDLDPLPPGTIICGGING